MVNMITSAIEEEEEEAAPMSVAGDIPHLPFCLVIDHVMPFLDDRTTWNNLSIACNCIHQTSSKVPKRPWPKVLRPPNNKGGFLGPLTMNKKYMACASMGGQIDLWDNQTGHVRTFHELKGTVQSIVFNPDGTRMAACSTRSNPRVWNLQATEIEQEAFEIPLLEEGANLATHLAFSTCFDSIIHCISTEGALWQCDLITGHCRQTRSLGISRWFSEMLTLSQNQKWVATSIFHTGVVKLLNLETLGDDRLLRHNADYINAICFDPSGMFVVTAGDHGIIQLWACEPDGKNSSQGEGSSFSSHSLIHRLHGLEAHISSVATDGVVIAASDVNGYIQVWSASTGGKLANLEGHDKSVNTVVFTPDGSMLVTAGNDGKIRFWIRSLWTSTTI